MLAFLAEVGEFLEVLELLVQLPLVVDAVEGGSVLWKNNISDVWHVFANHEVLLGGEEEAMRRYLVHCEDRPVVFPDLIEAAAQGIIVHLFFSRRRGRQSSISTEKIAPQLERLLSEHVGVLDNLLLEELRKRFSIAFHLLYYELASLTRLICAGYST